MAEKTQAQRLAERLELLKTDITKLDRKEAKKKFKLSTDMLSRYLTNNPETTSSDTAARLIEFFKDRIDKREQVIQD